MSAVAVTPRRDEIPGFIVEYPAMGDVVRSKEKKYYRAVYLQRANDSRKIRLKDTSEGYFLISGWLAPYTMLSLRALR